MTAAGAVVVTVAGLVTAVVFGATAGAATPPAKLLFAVQPGDGAPGVALATQPKVVTADTAGATVASSASIALTLTGKDGAALSRSASLACTATSVSASSGVAQFAGCKLDRGGIFTLTATDAADNLKVVSGNFFVSGPAQLVFSTNPGGGNAGAAWAKQPEVTVADAKGVAVAGATPHVVLGISAGTGAAGAVLTCTAKDVVAVAGIARYAGCAIDRSGAGYQLVAIDAADALISAPSPAFAVNSGPAAQLAFSPQPTDAGGGAAFPKAPVVVVQDAAGNAAVGNTDQVTLALKTGTGTAGATLTCPAATAVNGIATFTGCSVDRAGSGYVLVATDSASNLRVESDPFAVTSGQATRLVFTAQPGGGAGGAAFGAQPVVALTDGGGNAVPGPVTLSIVAGTGTAGATLTCAANPAAAAGGPATFAGCSVSATGSGYRLRATSGSLTVDSAAFDVTAGGAATLAFATAPGDGTGGAPLSAQPRVQVTDAGGNAAAGTVTLAIATGTGTAGATLTCATAAVPSQDGAAGFSGCAIDRAGVGYRLVATSGGARTQSPAFDVTVGAVSRLAFTTQPSGGTGGAAWTGQPVVAAQDAGGNLVPSSTSPVTLAVAGGTGSGTLACTATTLAAVRGSARYEACRIDRTAAAYRLTATAGGLTATSDAFAVTAGPAAALVFSGQPGGTSAGVPAVAQPAVTAVDLGGNPVAAPAPVTLAVTPGSGTGGALACATNPLGATPTASFSGCRVGTAGGGYTLTATAGALRVESSPFDVLLAPTVALGQAPTAVPLAQTFGSDRGLGVNPTNTADGVNTATGALTTAVDDLTVAGIGVPFDLTRTYNSADTTGGVFGPGWSSLFDMGVTFAPDRSTATIRDQDGQQVVFRSRGLGGILGWTAPAGARVELTCVLFACTVTRVDRSSFATTNGKVTSVMAPGGQGLRLRWDRDRVTVTVATTNRTPLVVTALLDTTGRITKVSSPTRSVSYASTGGLLTGVTDVRGGTSRLAYTGGRLTSLTDQLGRTRLTAAYDAAGRVVATTQPGDARRVDDTFEWSPGVSRRHALTDVQGTVQRSTATDEYVGNVLVRQTDPVGAVQRYSYDARVNLIAIQDPAGWVQQSTYDAADNLVKVVSPISSTAVSTVSNTYDVFHRPTTQTDATGNTTRYIYLGNLVGFVRPAGVTPGNRLVYDGQGRLVQLQTSVGREYYGYDAAGNRTSTRKTDLRDRPLNGRGTLVTYDEAGNQLTALDPRGNLATVDPAYRSTWTYDAAGHLLGQSVPGKGTTTYTVDAAGTTTSATNAAGTTTYSWDEAARRLTIAAPSGKTLQTYDASGHLLIQSDDAGGRTTTHAYDAAGREVATTDPAGVTSSFAFDAVGNVVRASDSTGNEVLTQFDSLGRQIRQVQNGVTTSRTAWDAAGYEIAAWDSAGALTSTTYTTHHRIASVTTPAGRTTYTYDPASDQLQRTTDANGHVTSYTYDGASQRLSKSVNGAVTRYAYDAAGNVASTTDPDGRTTATTFNAANLVTSTVSTQAGRATITVQQSYDAAGRRTQLKDAAGTHDYTYDAQGNLVKAVVAGGTFAYDYSEPGQVKETYPDGTVLTFVVDDAQNLMSVETGTPGTAGHVKASYVRDSERRTTALAYSNGVLETRNYDAQGNVLDQQLRGAAGALSDNTFTYDGQGNRLTQRATSGGTTTANRYGYDTTGRLTSFATATGAGTLTGAAVTPDPTPTTGTPDPTATVAGGPAVQSAYGVSTAVDPATGTTTALRYDGVGNRLSSTTGTATTTTSYDAADRQAGQTGSGAVTTRYDRTGNVTQLGATRFDYDAAGRVASATTGAKTVAYTYDGDGNRLSSTVGGVTTQFVWDAFGELPQVALERNGNGDLLRRYVYGDGPVAMQTPTATFFFHLDPVGSVDGLTDASGALVARYHYDGFGNVTTTGANPPANPILFQGQYRDADTGLYYLRARWYDARSGRFTQRDPLERGVGTPVESTYVFAANNPTVYTDPFGESEVPAAVYGGHRDTATNVTATTKLASSGVAVGIKAVAKLGGYAAAAAKAATAASKGAEVTAATAKAASIGRGLAVAAKGLAIAGIALQIGIAVSDCLAQDVAKCVGSVVGLAINVGFTVGCSFVTAGVGAAACAIAGAIIGIGLQYVITEFGPEIADGIVAGATFIGAGVIAGATIVAQQLTEAYDAASTFAVEAGGAIVTGFNDATTAISSGFDVALRTLTDAGYAAVALADVLAHTFEQGYDDAVAGLIGLGYQIGDIATSAVAVFSATALEVAGTLRDAFQYSAGQIAGALVDAYGSVAATTADVLNQVGFAVDEVAGVLQSTYQLAATQAAALLDGLGYGVGQIAGALESVFAQTDVVAAQVLAGLSKAGTDVAVALRDFYGDLGGAAAAALDAAAYTVGQIAGALDSAYATSVQAVVGILNDLDKGAQEIAGAIKSVFATVDVQAALLLRNVGFAVLDVAAALQSAFGTAATATASALRAVGFAVDEVADALKTTFNNAAAAAADVLRTIGFGVEAIGTALADTFSTGAEAAAQILSDIGYQVTEVTNALRDSFALGAQAAAAALKQVFDVNAIAGALAGVYAQSAQQVAVVFQSLGYAAGEIAAVLQDAFGQAAAAAAGILKALGIGATEIAAALQNVFGQAVSEVANLLASIGFSNDTINAIGGAFASFGQDVADCFTSFFTDC